MIVVLRFISVGAFIQTWIRDKAKLIESTDELGNDLGGIITLQRRLSGLERDLAAIDAKVLSNFCVTLMCQVKLNRFVSRQYYFENVLGQKSLFISNSLMMQIYVMNLSENCIYKQ